MLFAATGLPVIVAVTKTGVATGDLSSAIAAALVGAGMLSVLLFPLLALHQHRAVSAAQSTADPPGGGDIAEG